MKRSISLIGFGLLAATLIGAQPYGGRGPMTGPGYGYAPQAQVQAAPQPKTVEGKLIFVEQYPALQTKDKTYILHMPRFFFFAYTDGIKEGAAVKVDGFEIPALPGQDKPYFQVTKAVIAGKTYELSDLADGRGGMMGGRGMMGGHGMMGGGYDPRQGGPGMMGGRGGRW